MKLLTIGLVALIPTTAHADQLYGLYRPTASWAANWTCNSNNPGDDGGAVGMFHDIRTGLRASAALGLQGRLWTVLGWHTVQHAPEKVRSPKRMSRSRDRISGSTSPVMAKP
jgi:hypothetical protein